MKGLNMRKTILVLILLLLFPVFCFAGGITDKHRAVIARKNAVAPASCGASADVDYYNADTADWPIGNNANLYYAGQYNWSDASIRTICKAVVKISKSAGDISGKTLVFRIWTDNANDLGTNICSSANITGDNAWSSTSLEIDMANCTGGNCSANGCALSASTVYHFTIDMGGIDAANYASFLRTNSSTGVGMVNGWDVSKQDVYTGAFPNYDIQLRLHYYD